MGTAKSIDRFERERGELEAILSSGIFDRAPNLASFLQYICRKYFDGESAEIKEYSVAVEALGRPASFDPKRDSIVRVEAHRLRKRLKQYYETQGAGHPVRINFAAGSYVPEFVDQDPVEPAQPPVEVPAESYAWWKRLAFAAAVLGALGAAWAVWPRAGIRPGEAPALPPVSPAALSEVRIAVGSSEDVTDLSGNVWLADRFYEGGQRARIDPRPILGTQEPPLYFGRREGDFSYRIPLAPGAYELRLHFAETTYGAGNIAGGGETNRIFRVTANGEPLIGELDIIANTGAANTAYIRVFRDIAPASGGALHLRFESSSKDRAMVNAIEILPSSTGRMRPVRILAGERRYVDHNGNLWEQDRYFQGGQTARRLEDVEGARERELFLNERFGHFFYTIPVDTRDRYRVTLRFAENYFGRDRPGKGGDGSRRFDVFCNGEALLRDFDVHRTAGGSLRAVERTFRGIRPNAQGQIRLQFVPVRNYAMVNSIEVMADNQ